MEATKTGQVGCTHPTGMLSCFRMLWVRRIGQKQPNLPELDTLLQDAEDGKARMNDVPRRHPSLMFDLNIGIDIGMITAGMERVVVGANAVTFAIGSTRVDVHMVIDANSIIDVRSEHWKAG